MTIHSPTSRNNSIQNYITAAVITIFLFTAYNLNLRQGNGIDSIGNTLIGMSLLQSGEFDLSSFSGMLDNDQNTLDAALAFGSLQYRNDQLLSSYPIAAGLLSLPFFAAADLLGELNNWQQYRVVAKISASAYTALTAGIIFLTLTAFIPSFSAVLLTVLFGLGTGAWSIVSQDLWQHAPGMFCLAVSLLLITHITKKDLHILAALLGTTLGLAVCCRLLNIIPAIALALYILLYHPKLIVSFSIPAALLATILVGYNYIFFHNITGGYEAIYSSQWHGWRDLSTFGVYDTPFFYGLASILISPSKGALIYSPVLVFAFLFASKAINSNTQKIAPFLILWIISSLIILSKNTLWWGGTSFGSRYFSELTIPLILLIALAWHHIVSKKIILYSFFLATILSVSIQFLGAFYSPCGWAETPNFTDNHPERHWNWHDTEIVRCIKEELKHH